MWLYLPALFAATSPAPPMAQCPGSSVSPQHVPNMAGVQVFAHSEDGYNCTRIPTVVHADGVLLAIAEGRKWVGDGCLPHRPTIPKPSRVASSSQPRGSVARPDQPYTDVVLKRSTDGGQSWDSRTVIAPGGWCPTAVWDAQRKTVIVQYSLYTNDAMRQIISVDKGLTWATPTDLNDLLPAGRRNMVAGEGPGAMQLSLDHPKFPGRLLFIGHKWSPSGNYTGPPDPFEYVWFSDDGGKTFGFSSSLGANLNEGARVTAVSTDGGSTFSTPKPDAALINGHCQATMLRASDERILFANPASSHGRCNGTLRISTTNAATWSQEIALGSSAAEAFGYSCLARLPGDSDSVGIIFETAAPGCDGVSCQLRFRTVALKTAELGAAHTSSTAGN